MKAGGGENFAMLDDGCRPKPLALYGRSLNAEKCVEGDRRLQFLAFGNSSVGAYRPPVGRSPTGKAMDRTGVGARTATGRNR